jgi:hypothetical protein
VGGKDAGASSVQVVTSTVSRESACSYVSGVPHFAQNVRRTGGDDRNSAGAPFVKRKCVSRKVSHATTGDPAMRRHDWQWQTMVFAGLPRAW